MVINTPGKASVVIRKNGTRISVPAASVKLGTYLNHGDQIMRDGKTITVTDCKMEIKEGDVITRPKDSSGQPKKIPTIMPKKKKITLEIGDKVERFLRDGDFVF